MMNSLVHWRRDDATWAGFNPTLHSETDIPFSAHPQAVDPPYLVSWNNKQAPKWSAADDMYSYGDIFRMQLIRDHITGDLTTGGGKMSAAQLVSAMDLAATEDIRILKLWPIIHRVIGTPPSPALRNAVTELEQWYEAGGHRWDLNKTGTDSNEAAIQIMDAWWPLLLKAEFGPALGSSLFDQLHSVTGFADSNPGGSPSAPDQALGWYGYTDKDLRDLLVSDRHPVLLGTDGSLVHTTRRPTINSIPDHYSRLYCGGGSLASCRAALDNSLAQALTETPAQLYGHGICTVDPTAACFDQNQSRETSGIPLPPFPFQNRPTFQQVVELTRALPR